MDKSIGTELRLVAARVCGGERGNEKKLLNGFRNVLELDRDSGCTIP